MRVALGGGRRTGSVRTLAVFCWPWAIIGLLLALLVSACGTKTPSTLAYEGTELSGLAPGFRLLDHHGNNVALSDFRGKVVVLGFLDPECTDVCPLTAHHFRLTAEALGQDASRVAFLAVNVNPQKSSTADVADATRKWGVQDLGNWHYVTGSRDELRPVYEAYNILAEGHSKPDKPGEMEHSPGVYVIDRTGEKRWYLSTTFEGAPPLSELLLKHIRALLS